MKYGNSIPGNYQQFTPDLALMLNPDAGRLTREGVSDGMGCMDNEFQIVSKWSKEELNNKSVHFCLQIEGKAWDGFGTLRAVGTPECMWVDLIATNWQWPRGENLHVRLRQPQMDALKKQPMAAEADFELRE